MPADPAADAILTIVRNSPDDVQDRWIRWWLDGEPQETLRYGMELSRSITPGRHRLKASNTLSRDTVEFDAPPGGRVLVRCFNSIARGGYLSILVIGFAAITVRLEVEIESARGEGLHAAASPR